MSSMYIRFIVCLLYVFASVHALLLLDGAPRRVTKTLSVTNGGPWGSWAAPRFCAYGSFANGYAMKIEGNQHSDDDTSLNSIRLLCATLDGLNYGGDVTSGEGDFGTWHKDTKCQEGSFLTSFALQTESDQHSGDDTSANFVKFHCREFSMDSQGVELATYPGHGLWGSWSKSWSPSCGHNEAICGIQTRVEGYQHTGDDTALNNVKFFCCGI